MFLLVDTETRRLALADPNDFATFQVVPSPASASEELIGRTLANDGAPAGEDHVWITVDAVRRLALDIASAEWAASFAEMLDHAASQGWMSEDGVCIRAHIERG